MVFRRLKVAAGLQPADKSFLRPVYIYNTLLLPDSSSAGAALKPVFG